MTRKLFKPVPVVAVFRCSLNSFHADGYALFSHAIDAIFSQYGTYPLGFLSFAVLFFGFPCHVLFEARFPINLQHEHQNDRKQDER
jgi:hypothetical protein